MAAPDQDILDLLFDLFEVEGLDRWGQPFPQWQIDRVARFRGMVKAKAIMQLMSQAAERDPESVLDWVTQMNNDKADYLEREAKRLEERPAADDLGGPSE